MTGDTFNVKKLKKDAHTGFKRKWSHFWMRLAGQGFMGGLAIRMAEMAVPSHAAMLLGNRRSESCSSLYGVSFTISTLI